MKPEELQALGALRFDWAMAPDDVWKDFPEHVPELHRLVVRRVLGGVADARRSPDSSPLGLIVQGEKGSGKTHLLGWVREQVQRDGGYFFLVPLADGATFWSSVVEAMLDGLWRDAGDGGTQLQRLLRRLGEIAGTSRVIESAMNSPLVSPRGLNSFVQGLVDSGAHLGGPELQDTARALVLYSSKDLDTQDIAKDYFLSTDDAGPELHSEWGIRSRRSPQLIVRDLSRLIALTGYSVIAIDQIDALIARESASWDSVAETQPDDARDEVVVQVADGIMALREVTRRTLSVVACLPNTWRLLSRVGVGAARDRFRETKQLQTIPDPEVGRTLVEKRFTARFREVGFAPPYPSWPIAVEAFKDAPDFTPRSLLKRIDAHIEGCLDAGEVVELHDLAEALAGGGTIQQLPESDLDRLDTRFRELKSRAEVGPAFDPKEEDRVMPGLLAAGLTAWIEEQGAAQKGFALDSPPGAKPDLHARLRQTLNENIEAEAHWAFRAISSPNARNAQTRVRSAHNLAGIKAGDPSRSLFLLRNAPWPRGPRTQEILTEFDQAGGVALPINSDDLRTFAALQGLLAERDPALRQWLAARRPASRSELLGLALPLITPETVVKIVAVPEDDAPPTRPIPIRVPVPVVVAGARSGPAPGAFIELGRAFGSRKPVPLDLEALRQHLVIFAGSGSGKTVLLRRVVEEAALQGVSSIVLDPNNDLARLGDAWPIAPGNWGADDPQKAERYLAETDVVVWTPRREAGRPLSFQPLPDLAGVLDDADEFSMALDVAVGALAPRAKIGGGTRKAQEEQAVLREALAFFARGGGAGMDDLIDLLEHLPPEASRIGSAVRMAATMAETLKAAMVNDPLFGGSGEPLDPAVLLTPAPGKRARVSVISFIGLPSDAQRQGFVSQLQMALFSWFKKHPSQESLGGLLVMDEAQTIAPSGAMTVSTESTLILASQARKYGLGLIFATQAPKGLHNRIPGNAATQVFGFLNSSVQIDTAREIAKAKGGDVADISRLKRGEFYVAAEGSEFVKMHTAFCLSYHPKSPLAADEVIARARSSSGR